MESPISTGLSLALALFCIVLAICWIVLPFALIGTKPLLRELLREQRRTNELLAHLSGHQVPDPRLGPGDVPRSAPPPSAPQGRFTGSANLPPV